MTENTKLDPEQIKKFMQTARKELDQLLKAEGINYLEIEPNTLRMSTEQLEEIPLCTGHP